jgi:hypothetical protein
MERVALEMVLRTEPATPTACVKSRIRLDQCMSKALDESSSI